MIEQIERLAGDMFGEGSADVVHQTGRFDRLEWHDFVAQDPADVQHAVDASLGAMPDEAIRSRVQDGMQSFLRETFTRAFGHVEPERLDATAEPEQAWQRRVHEQMDDLKEWKEARSRTVGRPELSGAFALAMAESLLKDLGEDPSAQETFAPAPEETGQDAPQGAQGANPSQGGAMGPDEAPGASEAAGSALRQALRRAAKAGNEAVQNAEACLGLLPGTGKGDLRVAKQDAKTLSRIGKDPRLLAIAKMAGRLTSISRAVRRQRDRFTETEIVDVDLGNSLKNLVPGEVGRIAMADSTDEAEQAIGIDALMRFAKGSSMQWLKEDREPKGKGPILVLMDKSGSMTIGDRWIWASGMTIALLRLAIEQKRPFLAAVFDDGILAENRIQWNGKSAPPSLDEVLSYVSVSPSGGTDTGRALSWAFDAIRGRELKDKADVILITDGADSVDPTVKQGANAALWSIFVDCEPSGSIAAVSDRAVRIGASDDGAAHQTFVDVGGV